MSAASFLRSTFLPAIKAVILWPVHVQKVPQASEHLCPARLQTRCDVTETEAIDEPGYTTQTQYADTGARRPNTDPMTWDVPQGGHKRTSPEVTGMTRLVEADTHSPNEE